MGNPRLKKQIIEIVENQIRDNDPQCTKSTFLQLQKQGCTKKEAKEMIAAVLLEEMYDTLKYGKEFNEKKYEDNLKALLNDDFIFDDVGEELAEQEDIILKAKYNFYDALSEYDSIRAISVFMDIWDKIKKYVEDEFCVIDTNNNKTKPELLDIDDKTNFKYEFFNWFQDVEMELGNERMHKERIDYCKDILELFKWESDSPDNYKTAIGEAFNDLEEYKACDDWFEEWLNEEPDNPNAINIYLFCIITRDDMDRAIKITEEYIDKIEKCTMENEILFMRAIMIYEAMGNSEKATAYQNKIDTFKKELLKKTLKNNKSVYFNNPIKIKKKIPRNAPCPCGSGKKYKKCCGKN